jgi:hypothetical protein
MYGIIPVMIVLCLHPQPQMIRGIRLCVERDLEIILRIRRCHSDLRSLIVHIFYSDPSGSGRIAHLAPVSGNDTRVIRVEHDIPCTDNNRHASIDGIEIIPKIILLPIRTEYAETDSVAASLNGLPICGESFRLPGIKDNVAVYRLESFLIRFIPYLEAHFPYPY